MSQPLIAMSSNCLADYTSSSLMVSQLRGREPTAVIAELCGALERENRVPAYSLFYDAVIAREQLSSTAIGAGWALPHARLQGLPRLSFALGRTSRPLAWSVGARCPIHTVFLFAAPESEAKTYLALISAVAKLSQNPGLVEQLKSAPDPAAMFAVLHQAPLRLAGASSTISPVPSGR